MGQDGDVTGVGGDSVDGALCVFRPLWSLRGSVPPAALEPVALAVHFQDVDGSGEKGTSNVLCFHGLGDSISP